jgi:transposase-like protein
MRRIVGLAAWICRTLVRADIELLLVVLTEVLSGRRRDIEIRDEFRKKHPHYRRFIVDPLPPRTEPPPRKPPEPSLDWRTLLAKYEAENGRALPPVRRRSPHSHVPAGHTCDHCGAPSAYLYFNDGKKRTQLRCKVCHGLSPVERCLRKTARARYWCPHCGAALYRWKVQEHVTLYKCGNDHCPAYLNNLARLNPAEKKLRAERSSQFSVRYIYREYHFCRNDLRLPAPQPACVDLTRIHSPDNVVGLVLTFHVSFGLSSRMTARILREVFQIPLSYQTVLNYCEAAAVYLHRFNLVHKGPSDALCAGDEVFIKIDAKRAYTFLFIGAESHKITSYHVARQRDTHNAIIAMNEVARTAPGRNTHLVFDGLGAYPAGVHFINAQRQQENRPAAFSFTQVFGLENRDDLSAQWRPFKQLIERLNRTYRFHTRAASGFPSHNGALLLTVLFVTHYNFLRPHTSLYGDRPVHLDELDSIPTLQARWCKLLDMAMALPDAA